MLIGNGWFISFGITRKDFGFEISDSTNLTSHIFSTFSSLLPPFLYKPAASLSNHLLHSEPGYAIKG